MDLIENNISILKEKHSEANKQTILFECSHIYKSLQKIQVLKDISFKINEGEFISIVGPNGCGKTTLLKIIKGLLQPDSGQINFNKKLIKNNQDIGYIFQGNNLLPWRTVEDNIRLPLEIHNTTDYRSDDKIKSIIQLTGLSGAENKYPHQLSGGMKQLAAIAKALVDEDKVILMDEPFASLDPMTRQHMAQKLHRLWKETGISIIFVTHFIDEAVFLSDKIVVLSPLPAEVTYIAQTASYNGGNYNSYKYSVSETISQLMLSKGISRSIKKDNTAQGKKNNYNMNGKAGYIFSPVLAFIIFFIWKLTVILNAYPEFILPKPETVIARFAEAILKDQLIMHSGITIIEALIGFSLGFLVAVCTGYLLAKVPFLEKVCYPYITASQTTPVIAIAPLVALWLGFGIASKIFVSALIVFFPVLLTTITGIREISREMGEITTSLGASRWQSLIKLEIPGSLPYLFATMKVAITLALVGAVVGEFVSSNKGLGYLVIAAKGVLDTPLLFVTILALAIVGISLYSIIIIVEKVIFRSKTAYSGQGK